MNFPISKLLTKNKETNPETIEEVYGAEVEKRLQAQGYDVNRIQAIINNYLSDPNNAKYLSEFWELQTMRNSVKEEVKKEYNI